MLNIFQIFQSLRQGRLPPVGQIPEPLQDAVAAVSSLRGRWTPLTSAERLLTALRHKEPDRVPVTPVLCSAARQITGTSFPEFALDSGKAADVYVSGFDLVGGDLVVLLLDLSVEAADFGQKIIYPENSTPRPDHANPSIRSVEDYARLRPIRFSEAKRMQEFVKLCRLVVKKIGLRGLATGFVFGPLGVLTMMRGAEQVFKDCVLHPGEVRKACETITGVLLEFVQAQCETGVPAVVIDSLYASRNGLSKSLWEEIEGPFVREISRKIRENGLLVGIHNCGHDLYFDSQIKFMEPEVISFAHLPDDCVTDRELKERYGDRLTLIGYVPTPLLVQGSPREVMEACARQIEVFAKGGGYILAPGCEYPPNIPLTNAFALVKAAEKYS
ncbi:MAG: uroporphyrinogen decarboxylase family protein [bacterium]